MSGQVILYFDDQADAFAFRISCRFGDGGAMALAPLTICFTKLRAPAGIRLDAANAGKARKTASETCGVRWFLGGGS